MADAPDLGSGPERGGSSSLPARTNLNRCGTISGSLRLWFRAPGGHVFPVQPWLALGGARAAGWTTLARRLDRLRPPPWAGLLVSGYPHGVPASFPCAGIGRPDDPVLSGRHRNSSVSVPRRWQIARM